MGHRVYLNITTKETSEEIFEANNTIPLFWLTLLNRKIIDDFEIGLNLLEVNKGNKEREPEYSLLKIGREHFLENAETGKKFIENSFPTHLQLYNDFIYYLKLIFKSNQFIEVDVLEIANFSSPSALLHDLRNDVEAIKNNNPKKIIFYSDKFKTPFSLTGYDGFFKNEFKIYSQDYNAEIIKQEQERKSDIERKESRNRKEKISRKIKGILMILFGCILLGTCAIGIINEILSTSMEIGTAIFGFLSIITGIAKVKNRID
ncbi:hypothetical protein [Pedobacter punctiformis]|uniref:Uncharacterized protein n=1 Tax=Pedobacter punctiformis TaxID=3004097 RepID=A0ABT4L6Q3_9SPHI|nr:hypothetical protein [Pedobacter sp. HCMS5-2]MCZ4243598.1 hypothetical protein [Pedobacter sp. HCMS5-2]